MENIEKLIGKKVKEERQRLGLSQSDLAKNAKTSLTTINRLERGHQFPHSSTLSEIARALGVPEAALLYQDRPALLATKSEILTDLYSLLPSLPEDKLKEILTTAQRFSKQS